VVEPHSPPPARTRPAVVTISSYLLILFAVVQLVQLIVTLATMGTVRDVMRDAYAGTDANGADAVATVTYVIGIGTSALLLLLAAGLVVLALLNNRGRNGSRIATWVLGGILVCCTGTSLISGLAGSVAGTGGQATGDGPSPEELQRRLEEALPSWLTPVTNLLNVVAMLALLVALILLALPAANEFFRKQPQGWEPPVPGAAYPAYPQTPGYPQAQGQPGYPPTPGYPQHPGQPGHPHAAPGQPGPDQPAPGPSYDPPGPSGPSGDPGPSSSPGGDSGGGSGSSSDPGSSSSN
jgi:hypothetical protein